MNDILKGVIAFGVVCSMVVGALTYLAKADDLMEVRKDVQLVEMRLDQKIVGDQLYETQKAIREVEERNIKYTPDCSLWPDARDRKQYKELKIQQEELQKKQERLMKK
jgi:hypothetical protein